MDDLDRAVNAVVRECLGVRPGEGVLVVCDPGTRRIGELLRDEAEAAGADAVLALMAPRERDGAEPPDSVAGAMSRADVVLAPTTRSLSHTAARREATGAGARVASLPDVTEEMLARLMSADMEGLRRKGAAVAAALTTATKAQVTCPLGSDLRLGLEGRSGVPDAGQLDQPGAFGNLPCGEGFIAPLEGTAEGRLMIAGTISGYGIPSEPVEMTVAAGRLASAGSEAGTWLLAQLDAPGPDGRNVAELGIGTNEEAKLTGNLLEDEKILGTAHIAFGASAAIGGTVQVPVHIDCVVLEPDVLLDGEAIVRAGELLV